MIFPQDRISAVCQWSPEEASNALKLGRSGDLTALCDFTVYAVHLFLRKTNPPIAAIHKTKTIMGYVELMPRLVL